MGTAKKIEQKFEFFANTQGTRVDGREIFSAESNFKALTILYQRPLSKLEQEPPGTHASALDSSHQHDSDSIKVHCQVVDNSRNSR